ncbi:glycoside hydrolase family 3 N-terminal domain-containing protein [Pseudomonas sp. G.S.17]|uniref:glycoside hydrolase family 3 N-terminal domain-containing protein n=1 Tax=Pseudomonas sp. G.S.17 TaxID=3137451 RepID=UPI00311CCDEE
MAHSRLLPVLMFIALATVTSLDVSAGADFDNDDLIDSLLSRMTLEEKAGQLSQLAVQTTSAGPIVEIGGDDSIRNGRVGSLLNAYGVEATRKLQRVAVEESRLRIPLLFAFDVIHGFRTIFPVPLAEASAWDPELSRRTARAAAVEASAYGIHWTFAPMVDIARDPRWGRVVEGAGEDPFLGAALAVARVRGFHGTGPPDLSTMMTTAKHFAGYGAAEAGRDYNIADLSERTLREVYLPPFQAAVEAGTDTIMPGFNEVAGTPMHANHRLLNDYLRKQWGFNGLVISDFNGVENLIEHGVAATESSATQLAFNASVDIDMAGGLYQQQLPELVRSGQLRKDALDDAVRRVLQAKQRLGLFEDPYRYSDASREQAVARIPETRALAREAAQKSIVLLKNDQALLPLRKDIKKLVVVGALATDAESTLGPWSGPVRSEESVTVLEGIQQAVPSTTAVIHVPGASPESLDLSGIDDALRASNDADVIVAVLGETVRMTGEARSRMSLGLPGGQEALLARLVETGKPLVVVLMNGRPLALSLMSDQVPVILESWFLGSEMGHAVADVLFGDVNPSGKLPITFPRAVGQLPIYYARKNTGRPPSKESEYTSKYIDGSWTPLYPFGHGLSYTTFAYQPPRLSARRIAPDETLTINVDVSNTGPREGDEIVQLYLRQSTASVTRPVRVLRGFERVTLAPGETRTLAFQLDQDDLALLDHFFLRRVEPGEFTVFVGGSSATDNQASFEVTTGAQLAGPGCAIPRMLRENAVKTLINVGN